MRNRFSSLFLLLALAACQPSGQEGRQEQKQSNLLAEMGAIVPPGENREYSYTDKQDAYYYGRTHAQVNDDWFSGWNVRTRRIFKDYNLLLDGEPLDRTQATAIVYPHLLRREYGDAVEELALFDFHRVLSIHLEPAEGQSMAISLIGEAIQFEKYEDAVAFFRHSEYPDMLLGITTRQSASTGMVEKDSLSYLQADAAAQGFFIALDSTESAVISLLAEAQQNDEAWLAERQQRMERLISELNYFESSDKQLTQAIRWNILTLDQLITRQTGYGIYAGLPWFNDYWGRDLFISLPGACLVTGQFEVARNILSDFAKYQNTDENSSNYGRVPNRLRPGEAIYNTTDGSPRFVIALQQYVQYSGDTAIIRELYPAVKRATEGVLKYWVDDKSYLTHDAADTWMDARIDQPNVPAEEKLPWSPRGNRANDIQALWYGQLQASIFFANHLGEAGDSKRWIGVAKKLRNNFIKDFLVEGQAILADRLRVDGTPDFTLRPNQLFALDFIKNDSLRFAITRQVWEGLVYPWGVASLNQEHPEFHPFHENPDYYHKDAAYHNGAVWLWNNGIAMQRLLEAGQADMAYALFDNMSRMTLEMGAVGSLSENTDALPRPGADWPKLSGTFLQAWSNAEYLRVWYEYFMGIQPLATDQALRLHPIIPNAVLDFRARERVFNGFVEGEYKKETGKRTFRYTFRELEAVLLFQVDTFATRTLRVKDGDVLLVFPDEPAPYVELNGTERFELEADSKRADERALEDQIFKGLHFARPHLLPGLGALSGKDWLKQKREREAAIH
ncbi:MAG: hypothetical protein H6573_08030 [Lewinellaceae bacterium]|nr:hypothetical protein [Phaeodactylibacter sp.]MCB0611656.1 hypothetical protein [Phaeodactylibacter sp.]MCB9347451.1 hypothetical protein [Lewinellaceae bacterium]